ncbi:hypothetical protein [Nocardioides sp. LS1]|uniref:hypothetical protein n=1 Tax=Nocardioides sp. LS1 TaxID=1027620 RepID=UPI000F61F31D|nr:hypothetical protein [Nocardioides sp. LS1]GCD90123.1 hypothetical protein NLS1_21290 [Nocardioides sp. LS1]
MKRGFSTKAWLLIALVAVMINLPLVHSSITSWRVDRSGVDVTATVVDAETVAGESPQYFVKFHFSKDVDPDQTLWSADVEKATYDDASASKQVAVRVLPGNPAAFEVDGQAHSSLGLVVTIVADLALLGMVLLAWRFRGRLRPQLRGIAVDDVERCAPGSALERLDGDLYLVRGEVSHVADHQVVIDLGDRSIAIELDGHSNDVGYQQPAQVRARLVG